MLAIAIVIVILLLIIWFIIWFINQRAYEAFAVKPGYVYDSGVPGPCIGIIASVHGNEPAGGLLLEKLIKEGWFASNVKHGSVRIIATPNPIGLKMGIRSRFFKGDLNRTFYSGTNDADALEIIKFFESCDIVIDFHEGWGFHQIQPESLGSTVMANSEWSDKLARNMVKDLNADPLMTLLCDPRKLFVVMPKEQTCDISTTFACYRQRIGQHHILVETSGQNDVQPLQIRQSQVFTLIKSLIHSLD